MRLALAASFILLLLLISGGIWAYTPDLSRKVLEARYQVGPGDYCTVAGIRLHVRDTGPPDAPPLILLHGFGASLQTWDAWSDALSRSYRVIRLDLPGFGLTGPDPSSDYSDHRAMDILAALMDQLGAPHATLIGNSLGAKIAWNFAARYPARVDRLVIISPDGFASPGFDYGRTPHVPFVMRLLPYMLPQPLVRMSLAPAYSNPKNLTDATVTRYRDMMRAPGVRQAIIARLQQVMLQPPEPLLRRIKAPTLILWGERDGMIPFTNAADYQHDIAHARLVPLPGLGHVPFEEAPETALVPLLQFLAETNPSTPPVPRRMGTHQPSPAG